MKYLISISGGKDSTACLIWGLRNLPKKDIVPYFIDTKWEHESVYEYLNYLEKKLNIKIKKIESEGMESLCIRQKMMPNRVMRFCTENLKIKPAVQFFYEEFISKNIDFINIVGVRREESSARAEEEVFKIVEHTFNRKKLYVKTLQPIVYWDTKRVFNYLKENDIEPNPLYKKGFRRVGCYPCIFATKFELINMEEKYKQRLRDLEAKVSKVVGKKVKFFAPEVDKHLNQNTLFDLGCVNQFGICE